MHVMEIENTFPVPKMKSPAMAANDSWMPSKKKSHGSKTSLTSSKENVFHSFPLDKIQVSGQQMHTPRVGNGDDRHDFSNSYNMVKKSNSEGPGSLTTVSYAIPPVKEVLSLQGLKELIKGVGFSNIPVQHPEMTSDLVQKHAASQKNRDFLSQDERHICERFEQHMLSMKLQNQSKHHSPEHAFARRLMV